MGGPGFVDLVVEADMKPYDFLAMVPIIQGAGGAITNWSGETIHWACTPAGDYALNGLAGDTLHSMHIQSSRFHIFSSFRS